MLNILAHRVQQRSAALRGGCAWGAEEQSCLALAAGGGGGGPGPSVWVAAARIDSLAVYSRRAHPAVIAPHSLRAFRPHQATNAGRLSVNQAAGTATVERETGSGRQTVELPLPAVVTADLRRVYSSHLSPAARPPCRLRLRHMGAGLPVI